MLLIDKNDTISDIISCTKSLVGVLTTRANTRSQQKYVFKVDAKIGNKYERSPYYVGTRLWNKLSKDIQFAENVFVFKKEGVSFL